MNFLQANSDLLMDYVDVKERFEIAARQTEHPTLASAREAMVLKETVVPFASKKALEILIHFFYTRTVDRPEMLACLRHDPDTAWEILGVAHMFDLSPIIQDIIEVQVLSGYRRAERIYSTAEKYVSDLGMAKLYMLNDLSEFVAPIVCSMLNSDDPSIWKMLTKYNSEETIDALLDYAASNPALGSPDVTVHSDSWSN